MNFSVLMPVYFKASPAELKVALASIWDEQTLKPSEIVIVKDGPLTEDLDDAIQVFSDRAPVKLIALDHNVGLGTALRAGVEACHYEYIARMDSDDISVPERFQKQITFLEKNPEYSICGSMVDEFEIDPSQIHARRIVPENDIEMHRFVKFRNPFNHMTVIFKKESILQVGNYQHLLGYEDYWLWARCLAAGYHGKNLPESLVKVRSGRNFLMRRRGLSLLRSEVKIATNLHKIGLLTSIEMVRNILLRGGIRLLPIPCIKMIYAFCRRSVL